VEYSLVAILLVAISFSLDGLEPISRRLQACTSRKADDVFRRAVCTTNATIRRYLRLFEGSGALPGSDA